MERHLFAIEFGQCFEESAQVELLDAQIVVGQVADRRCDQRVDKSHTKFGEETLSGITVYAVPECHLTWCHPQLSCRIHGVIH